MEVRYLSQTGRYGQQLLSLRRRIRALTKNSDEFYIGKTNNPEDRASAHEVANLGRWEEMIVLYETRSAKFVSNMERELIDYFWEDCINPIAGGGGPDGSPPYYVYILR